MGVGAGGAFSTCWAGKFRRRRPGRRQCGPVPRKKEEGGDQCTETARDAVTCAGSPPPGTRSVRSAVSLNVPPPPWGAAKNTETDPPTPAHESGTPRDVAGVPRHHGGRVAPTRTGGRGRAVRRSRRPRPAMRRWPASRRVTRVRPPRSRARAGPGRRAAPGRRHGAASETRTRWRGRRSRARAGRTRRRSVGPSRRQIRQRRPGRPRRLPLRTAGGVGALAGSPAGASGPLRVTDTSTGVADAVVAASATQPAPASNGSQTARLAASAAGRRRRRVVDVSVLATPLLSPG